MKYLKNTTLCLAAIVLIALGNKAAAATIIDPASVDQVDSTNYTGASLIVNDTSGDGGSIILTNPANATLDIGTGGVVKVGLIGLDTGKTGTGATTVENGAILEITAATADCIPGDLEVKSGGILQVDDGVDVPDTGVFGSTLQVDSGAIIKLGAGSKWSKNVTVS